MTKTLHRNLVAAACAGLAAALATALTAPAALAAPLPTPTPAAAVMGDARPIAGWIQFCNDYPSECVVDTSEAAEIRLDPQNWETIREINRRVNAAITPKTDWELYGVADYWTFPTEGYGDCEDYQLLKRHLLVRAGLPRRAMRMTVVIDEKGEGHAVLMLRTDRGDLVLDNKTDQILPWHQTGYVYVKRESTQRVGWRSLGHATSPTVTARY